MNLSLYENASALRGLEQYQNVIANNIAASHVAGFKKVAVSFEGVDGGEIARSTHGRLRNEMPGSFPVMKNQVDYNEGEIKETTNPWIGIQGDGFFAFINANGIVSTLVMVNFTVILRAEWLTVWGMSFRMKGQTYLDSRGGDPTIDQEGQVFQGSSLLASSEFFLDEPSHNYRKLAVDLSPKKKE